MFCRLLSLYVRTEKDRWESLSFGLLACLGGVRYGWVWWIARMVCAKVIHWEQNLWRGRVIEEEVF